ncbi:MAG: SDR family NAD(P)-dependent oxidoreductase [Mucilaginibacter sp.]|uniref:SDR family NAD(P)-dependent oxidoreductase n=1 Tax=Mucilaginibacter sp. TaxID=1882438 RepID=UPI0034E47855
MRNIAVILAGGTGARLNLELPKQFFKVAGKTVLEHTLDIFQKHQKIDEIAIVGHPDFIGMIEDSVNRNAFTKVKKILIGGNERYLSTWSAINAYEYGDDCHLIFHDAVRPLVSERIIDEVIQALDVGYRAVDVAVPAVDTIIQVTSAKSEIETIPDRSKLMRGQTPQAFTLQLIKKAYQSSFKDLNFKSTDDCGVVKKYLPAEPIFVVKGEESNMKLTYKEDTYLLDRLFQLKTSVFTNGPATDFTGLKDKVLVVFGGSYGIGKSIVDIAAANKAIVYPFSRSCGKVDICCRTSVAEALKNVYQQEGRIDFVINTAAVLKKEPLMNMDYEQILEAVNTNYLGTVHIALESFGYLKESQGHLLFFTSSSYTRGRAYYSLYSSSKAAVVNFVQAISQEWDGFKIKVNCINPERTHTPMRIRNFGNENLNTLLSAENVANASIATLLSEHSGQVIDVKLPTF